MMKKQTGWLWVAALLAGMASCGKKIPDDIIQPDAMESLLYDYHLASTMSNSLSYTENYKKDAYYKYVFESIMSQRKSSTRRWYGIHVTATSWLLSIRTCRSVMKVRRAT